MNSTAGLLVIIEGINGAGKTTVINKLSNHYAAVKIPFVVYKFPNRNGIYGKQIDGYLKGTTVINSKYDIINMFAANRESVRESIIQDIIDGKIVICDRYIYSAIAYHIPNHVINPTTLMAYCSIIGYFDKKMPNPDITYIIDGDHLVKREGIVPREKFHYYGLRSMQMFSTLVRVVSLCVNKFMVLKNRLDKCDELVNFIVNDIEYRR